MKCFKCKSAERHGSLSYCQPCYNIHVKELRDKKKAKMEEPVMTTILKKAFKIVESVTETDVDRIQSREAGIDRLYVHTGPNPKIKRCQAGYNGKACPNEGMPATIGEYKAWLCFAHSSMGKLVEA